MYRKKNQGSILKLKQTTHQKEPAIKYHMNKHRMALLHIWPKKDKIQEVATMC